jgi:hypothetical protein
VIKALVVIVKFEARLEVGSKANGTCLHCQVNFCDLKKIRLVSKIHTLVHNI